MVDLSLYNSRYEPGSLFKVSLWMLISRVFFETSIPFPSKFKIIILNFFGACVKSTVVIKPSVKIKYPWKLKIGNYSWVGENVWIDNLAEVNIASNCCISQGAMILTGNHDYTSPTFDLIIGRIVLESGSWVGAKSVVCPGVTLEKNSVLAVGSVATKDLEKSNIYQGNPAVKKKLRVIS